MITTDSFFAAQSQQKKQFILGFSFLLLLFAVISLGYGPAGWDWRLSVAWLLPEYFNQFSDLQINVVTQIRLPRFILAIIVGAVLAQTGAATQALCRNPLADPSIIGISGGAAVMAVGVIALAPKFGFNPEFYLPYAAFLGALIVTMTVYQFSKHNNEINVTSLILIGVAFNALAFALIGLFSFYADDSSLRLINYWTMGSLGGASWSGMTLALPLIIISFVGLYLKRKELNMMLLGEAEARYMGVNIKRLKSQVIILVALGIGSVVALSGMIGFIGLVVPHITRLLVGANLQQMLGVCALLGGVVLLFSDWLAKIVVAPAELPIGIITALIGAPLFVYLLRRQNLGGDRA